MLRTTVVVGQSYNFTLQATNTEQDGTFELFFGSTTGTASYSTATIRGKEYKVAFDQAKKAKAFLEKKVRLSKANQELGFWDKWNPNCIFLLFEVGRQAGIKETPKSYREFCQYLEGSFKIDLNMDAKNLPKWYKKQDWSHIRDLKWEGK